MRAIELTFKACEHVNVPLPETSRVGRLVIVGKTYNTETGTFEVTEPQTVRLSQENAVGDKAFFRRCVLEGELMCANAETASALGVPFQSEK